MGLAIFFIRSSTYSGLERVIAHQAPGLVHGDDIFGRHVCLEVVNWRQHIPTTGGQIGNTALYFRRHLSLRAMGQHMLGVDGTPERES